ncbi:vascular cell adhesion protein 1 isoform 2-T2 [Leptodactylus fuscus]|uniref:vascular cell adhesion protein 1 isoform X2 n=1 Tax=Leptodactylus fuscus TaxID=238119 RepID=UPI003F4EA28E
MAKISTVSATLLTLCLQIIFTHTSAIGIHLLSPQNIIKAQIGEELDIVCSASKCNTKEPGFTWSNLIDKTVSGTVKTNGKTSILTMKVGFETDGSYRCTVSCDNPPAEKRFTIMVYSFPSEPILHISSLVVGQQSRITCTFPNIYPAEMLSAEILLAGASVANIDDAEINYKEYEEQNITLTYDVVLVEEMDTKEVTCVAILKFLGEVVDPITKNTTQTLALMYPPGEPKIVVQPSKRVNAGEEVHLLCSSNSRYQAVVQWVKLMGGQELEMSSDGHGALTLSNVETEYSGVYICYVENSAGRTSSSVEINVQGLPEKPTLSIKPGTRVVAGEEVIIECLASNNTNVTLWKIADDGEISLDSARGFRIDAAEPIDAAVYKCISENQYGVSETSESLTVEYPPRETILTSSSIEVTDGHMVTLTCVSKGVPIPKFDIYKLLESGESVLLSSDPEVTLSEVTSGIYECQASNVLGSDKDNLEILVGAPPKNTVLTITPSHTVREGDSVYLRCKSESSPAPKLVLRMKTDLGMTELESVHGEYRISHATSEHTGTYVCESSNGIGQQTVETTLTVLVPPRNTIVAFTPSPVVTEGDSVQILCSSEGSPDLTHVLMKRIEDGTIRLLSNDGSYNITHVGMENAGTYVCKSKNKAGEEVVMNTLTVQDRQHSSPRFNPTSMFIFGSVAFVSAGVIASIVYHLKKSKLQGSYSLVKALRSKV